MGVTLLLSQCEVLFICFLKPHRTVLLGSFACKHDFDQEHRASAHILTKTVQNKALFPIIPLLESMHACLLCIASPYGETVILFMLPGPLFNGLLGAWLRKI